MIRRLLVTALLAAAVVVAGCSGEDSGGVNADDRLLEVHLPWTDPEEADRLQREFHTRIEDLIAECMQDQGLEYVPVALEAVAYGPGTGISRAEYARRFGFGISTNDETFAAFSASTDSVGDPNREYEESLSTDRAISYSEQRSRCSREAHEQMPQPPGEFDRAVDDLIDLVRSDPSVIEAEAEWVDCVRGDIAGLPEFSTLDQLTRWFWEESERVADLPGELARLQDLEREVSVRHLECESALLAAMREVGDQLQDEVAVDFRELFDRQREFLGS